MGQLDTFLIVKKQREMNVFYSLFNHPEIPAHEMVPPTVKAIFLIKPLFDHPPIVHHKYLSCVVPWFPGYSVKVSTDTLLFYLWVFEDVSQKKNKDHNIFFVLRSPVKDVRMWDVMLVSGRILVVSMRRCSRLRHFPSSAPAAFPWSLSLFVWCLLRVSLYRFSGMNIAVCVSWVLTGMVFWSLFPCKLRVWQTALIKSGFDSPQWDYFLSGTVCIHQETCNACLSLSLRC